MVTGIFARIVAEAAEEDCLKNKKEITPWWRIIQNDGSLNKKYSGGTRAQAAYLKEDGRTVINASRGEKLLVLDFEN